MLTLTITEPHKLTEQEKQAILAFAQISTIKREDRPDVGAPAAPPLQIPRVTEAAFDKPIDAAKIFGGLPSLDLATTAASSVPLPPSVPPIPTPPAPSAAPAASSLPSASVATAVGLPAGGVPVDTRGLPWDVRIHASTKNKNGDGGWKKKKNTPDELIVTVEAELRALMGIKGPLQLPAGTVAISDRETPTTFPQLMGWVTKEVAEGRITQADVTAIVQPIGLASVVGLNNRPDLIPQVLAALKAKIEGAAA